MRWRTLVLLLALAAGCDGGSPTAPGGGRRGTPNATALTNLALVRQLEREQRRTTLLTNIGAVGVGLNGRLLPGGAWGYEFAEITEQRDTRFAWSVFSDGSITFEGPLPPLNPVARLDLGPFLQVDSDQAVDRALGFGADEYVRRHPEAMIQVRYFHLAGQVVCHLHFLDIGPGRDGCEIDIFLSASSGELLARDLSCL